MSAMPGKRAFSGLIIGPFTTWRGRPLYFVHMNAQRILSDLA
jgi:hypothetical protein